MNLSKPRKPEEELNNNAEEEFLRKRKFFLDNKSGYQPLPHLFNPTSAAATAAGLKHSLHPSLFSPPPSHPQPPVHVTTPTSASDFAYFRNFPGFSAAGAATERTSAVAAAVGLMPPIGQPASLAALRNSSAAALGLHQVSMMDQVRQEHQRQQQQQQQQQAQQQSDDVINSTRKCLIQS